MKKRKYPLLGDMLYTKDPFEVYILASLIVEHIDIAYSNGFRVTTFPIGKKRKSDPGSHHDSPPYLEVEAAIAYLTKRNAGRDGPLKFVIKRLTELMAQLRTEAAKP